MLFEYLYLHQIKSEAKNILKVKNPSDEFIIKAIKANRNVVLHIEHDDRFIMAAIQENIIILRDLPPQSEKINAFAISIDPRALKYIKDPSHDIQLAVVKRNGLLVGILDNPAPDVQLAAVKNTCNAITRIKNPTEEAELQALSMKCTLINEMRRPSAAAVIFALELAGKARRQTKLDLKSKPLTVDQWWEIVRRFPAQYEMMNLNSEQISYAILCA